jgi:hypothetical protein
MYTASFRLPTPVQDLHAGKFVLEAYASPESSSSFSSVDGPTINSSSNGHALTTASSPPPRVTYFTRPFEFLSLGIMAYVGNDKALTQVHHEDALSP